MSVEKKSTRAINYSKFELDYRHTTAQKLIQNKRLLLSAMGFLFICKRASPLLTSAIHYSLSVLENSSRYNVDSWNHPINPSIVLIIAPTKTLPPKRPMYQPYD